MFDSERSMPDVSDGTKQIFSAPASPTYINPFETKSHSTNASRSDFQSNSLQQFNKKSAFSNTRKSKTSTNRLNETPLENFKSSNYIELGQLNISTNGTNHDDLEKAVGSAQNSSLDFYGKINDSHGSLLRYNSLKISPANRVKQEHDKNEERRRRRRRRRGGWWIFQCSCCSPACCLVVGILTALLLAALATLISLQQQLPQPQRQHQQRQQHHPRVRQHRLVRPLQQAVLPHQQQVPALRRRPVPVPHQPQLLLRRQQPQQQHQALVQHQQRARVQHQPHQRQPLPHQQLARVQHQPHQRQQLVLVQRQPLPHQQPVLLQHQQRVQAQQQQASQLPQQQHKQLVQQVQQQVRQLPLVTITSNACTSGWKGIIVLYHCDNCPNVQPYTKYTYTYTAIANLTRLTFAFREDVGVFALDTVSVTSILAPSVQLLVNNGFETGSESSWTYCCPSTATSWAGVGQYSANIYNMGVTYQPQSGTFFYYDGTGSGCDYLSQKFSTTVGGTYTISYWLYNLGSGSASSADVIMSH
ncbi:unnamed protein product [Rotaria magnacalcarata]|uniref:Uncharacterized protein n=1 Tax=Rotaria magnacalcarata TaxID=392030 RepID=A0A820F8G8_9BILA|nr:unnamed protein product [Rotaria magnacalcarata]